MNDRRRKPTHPGDILRKGSVNCPNDGERLHWASMYGWRVYSDGFYQGRCPKCEITFKVKR
jgi:hypothetical protein